MLITIIIAIITLGTATYGLTIQRQIDHNKWTTLPDRLKLPQSQCKKMDSYCSAIGARKVSPCTCECDDPSKILIYFEGIWKCMDNTQVKHLTNCPMNVTIYRENAVNIFTIPLNPPVTIEYNASRFLVPRFCWFYTESELLECNGSWSKFSAGNMFSISSNLMITPSSQIFKVRGRVIKVNIDCRQNGRTTHSFCILFKVEGRQNCSSMLLPSNKAAPPSIPATTTSESIRKILPQTAPLTGPASTTVQKEQTFAPNVKTTREPASNSDNCAFIAGAATGAAVLLITVVVIFSIMLIKRRRERQRIAKTTTGDNDSVDNRIYGLADKNIHHNSNNNTTEVPVYAKPYMTEKTKVPEEQGNSVFYHTLEDPNDGLTNNGPIYNVLEAPVSHDPPQYRALEGNVPHVYGTLIYPCDNNAVLNIQGYDSIGSSLI